MTAHCKELQNNQLHDTNLIAFNKMIKKQFSSLKGVFGLILAINTTIKFKQKPFQQ
ncbi:hypothetical protein HNQ00_000263 [Flavobacterium sp. 14A]|nr:hypothetical protein [Flavobacterium sp. 14A]